MEQKFAERTDVSNEAVGYINEDSKVIDLTEEAADVLGYTKETILGVNMLDIIVDTDVQHGRNIERHFAGEKEYSEELIVDADGKHRLIGSETEPVSIDGQTYLKHHNELLEIENPEATKDPSSNDFDDIDSDRLQEITKNVRVDHAGEEMNLGAIMVDLAAGHNEIEQYKEGALSLHQAIDERLAEEEQRNPDSQEVAVLKEVKDSAFGLYLRIQRGDAELHGDRDGEYSGYFK